MRDRLDDLEQHELRGKQAQRPPRPSCGRCAACQVDQLGLGGPIELARVQARLRLALDCGHQSRHHTCPARPFDRRDPHAELVDDLLIRQARVRQQHDSCALGAVRANPTTADQRFEPRTFVVRELDEVALHARAHPPSPRGGPSSHPSHAA